MDQSEYHTPPPSLPGSILELLLRSQAPMPIRITGGFSVKLVRTGIAGCSQFYPQRLSRTLRWSPMKAKLL
jgi:hypothetical protein